MKIVFIIICVLFVAMIMGAVVQWEKSLAESQPLETSKVSLVTIEGHKFVVAEKSRWDGGIAILHFPGCRCGNAKM